MSADSETVLKRFIDSERIPHAFIFVDSNTEWINQSARSFAKEIFTRFDPNKKHLLKMDHNNHPDYHEYVPTSKTGQYSIEQIKQICNQSYLFPNEAPKQFFVLKYAERMNDPAANALLKTLEEPTENSIFILLVQDYEKLLPTIASRAHSIFFHSEHTESQDSKPVLILKELLAKWPNINYNDIYSSCMKIQKAIDEDLQKEDENKDPVFVDRVVLTLLVWIQKWYQEKMFEPSIMNIKRFEKCLEEVKMALNRSMKPSMCLEHLLLNFAS